MVPAIIYYCNTVPVYRPFLKYYTLTNKAAGTIQWASLKSPQNIQDPNPRLPISHG